MSAVRTPPRRGALARVLQGLMQAELAAARGRRGGRHDSSSPGQSPLDQAPPRRVPPREPWHEDARIAGRSPGDLGCDSLEALWLTSAACEMFHLFEAGEQDAIVRAERFGEWIDIVTRAVARNGARVSFTTSGSTGKPKRCTHRLDDLDRETRHLATLFADRTRVLAFVPAHHIYGFIFTALLPDLLDAAVVDPAHAVQALSTLKRGDLVVSFPERWMWLERTIRQWPDGVSGVTSTAPCPRALIEALMGQGLAAMTEVYGSSETAGVATRAWPDTGYRLMPHWTFDDGHDAAVTRVIDGSGRCFELPDAVRRAADGRFTIVGRRDDAVQVGGVNVRPDDVAAALRERPGVSDAAVRLMRPDEGLRLKAFIVADVGWNEDDLRSQLDAWMGQALEPAARACALTFGRRLPTNDLGKSADW